MLGPRAREKSERYDFALYLMANHNLNDKQAEALGERNFCCSEKLGWMSKAISGTDEALSIGGVRSGQARLKSFHFHPNLRQMLVNFTLSGMLNGDKKAFCVVKC